MSVVTEWVWADMSEVQGFLSYLSVSEIKEALNMMISALHTDVSELPHLKKKGNLVYKCDKEKMTISRLGYFYKMDIWMIRAHSELPLLILGGYHNYTKIIQHLIARFVLEENYDTI